MGNMIPMYEKTPRPSDSSPTDGTVFGKARQKSTQYMLERLEREPFSLYMGMLLLMDTSSPADRLAFHTLDAQRE
eukprot:scaffold57154_cov17-Prasinocladus_malaysianus.AAC.3